MAIFIGALLALLSVAVIMLPFLKRWQGTRKTVLLNGFDETIREREAIYETVRTLRLDYEMGNVGEDEFKAQLQSYRLQAADVLRKMERLRDVERQVEEEVLSLRKSLGSADGTKLCVECSNPVPPEGRLCPHCGADIEGE